MRKRRFASPRMFPERVILTLKIRSTSSNISQSDHGPHRQANTFAGHPELLKP